tara:strand:- start:59 stop:457 length:399 start_codon:yes stop_codon:yes gene_type:complete
MKKLIILFFLIISCNVSQENKETAREKLDNETQNQVSTDKKIKTLEVFHDALMRSHPNSSNFFMRIPKGTKVEILDATEQKLPGATVVYLKVKYIISEGDNISFDFYRDGDLTTFRKPGVYTGWVSEYFFIR